VTYCHAFAAVSTC